jgi:hypothetical protein
VNLAVHVSAPRELRLPLRTGIEEVRQIFLTGRAGRAVKQSQQLACAARGPPGMWSCQCQAIPTKGGVTTRGSDASSLMSLLTRFLLSSKGRSPFESFSFRGMYH